MPDIRGDVYKPFAVVATFINLLRWLGLAVIEWLVRFVFGLLLLAFVVQGLGCVQAGGIDGYCLP